MSAECAPRTIKVNVLSFIYACSGMSAVCYLFARNIQDLMFKEGLNPPPIGLISTEWGGTPVESWSPDSALDKCDSRLPSKYMKPNRGSNACPQN